MAHVLFTLVFILRERQSTLTSKTGVMPLNWRFVIAQNLASVHERDIAYYISAVPYTQDCGLMLDN